MHFAHWNENRSDGFLTLYGSHERHPRPWARQSKRLSHLTKYYSLTVKSNGIIKSSCIGETLLGIKPRMKVTWDHKHKVERIYKYEFESASQLIEDFWKAVEEILK